MCVIFAFVVAVVCRVQQQYYFVVSVEGCDRQGGCLRLGISPLNLHRCWNCASSAPDTFNCCPLPTAFTPEQ